MTWLFDEELRRLLTELVGWTLIHSTWQGLLLFLLAAGACRTICRRAESRYLLCCVVLVLMPLLPVATVLVTRTDVLNLNWTDPPLQTQRVVQPEAITQQPPAMPSIRDVFETRSTTASTSRMPVPSDEPMVTSYPHWLGWLVGTWLLGAFAVGLHALLGLFGCWRLRFARSVLAPAEWADRIDRLARRMRIKRSPKLLLSQCVSTPMVMGLVRPVIILPVSLITEMPVQQIELILLHELAHIRRYDLLVNLLQVVIETCMFYHPGVWWLSRKIRSEREKCCDALVVASGERNVDYAEVLLSFADGKQLRMAPGATGGVLQDRIAYLLQSDSLARPMALHARRGPAHWLIIAGLLFMLLAGLWMLYGQAITQRVTQWRLQELIENPMPDPARAIVIDWLVPWSSTDWGGKRNTNTAAFTPTAHGVRLAVGEQGASHVWMRMFDEPINTRQYATLVLKYRFSAGGIDSTLDKGYTLWADDGSGPVSGGVHLIGQHELRKDGKAHTLIKDLGTFDFDGPITGLACKVTGIGSHISELEILDLRFVSAKESSRAEGNTSDTAYRIRVVNNANLPIANATLRTSAERHNSAGHYKTDEAGETLVRLTTKQSRYLRVSADGFAPVMVGPIPSDQDATQPILVTLLKSTDYHGVVQDSQGNPLPNATVELIASGLPDQALHTRSTRVQLLTDKQGRFHCSHLPGAGVTLHGFASHPGFLSTVFQAESDPSPEEGVVNRVLLSDLQTGSARISLSNGIARNGVLVVKEGRPESYTVVLESPTGMVYGVPVHPDAEGHFVLPPAPAGRAVLAIKRGEKLVCSTINISDSREPLIVDYDRLLERDMSLKVIGTVLDKKTRQPVAEFNVTRAHRHLMDFRGANGLTHWEDKTRQTFTDGKFEVPSVSSNLPTLVKVEAEGYQPAISRMYLKHEGEQAWQVLLERLE